MSYTWRFSSAVFHLVPIFFHHNCQENLLENTSAYDNGSVLPRVGGVCQQWQRAKLIGRCSRSERPLLNDCSVGPLLLLAATGVQAACLWKRGNCCGCAENVSVSLIVKICEEMHDDGLVVTIEMMLGSRSRQDE